MLKCSIFAIGQELLEGSIIDTNSQYIAKKLIKNGFKIKEIKILPDNIFEIVKTLQDSIIENDIIITTGGLGPTFDDLTIEALSKITNKKLILNEKAFEDLKVKMLKRGRTVNAGHIKQVMIPEGAILFKNEIGTAPGVGIEINDKLIISLPGVPSEMQYILENEAIPYLEKRYIKIPYFTSDLYFTNVAESDVDKVIREHKMPNWIETIINVSQGKVIVRLRSSDKNKLLKAENILKTSLSAFYFGKDDETLEIVLIKQLTYKGLTISTAESCTGGLIWETLTRVSGSSLVFKGGFIVYSNEAKIRFLNIDENLLQSKGAVSSEVAYNMAINVAKKFETPLSIAVTGIAGPTGGSSEKPVGLVYIGIFLNNNCSVFRHIFYGNRQDIR
jgi:nicotinamide-nucleotide amidase